MIRDKDDTLGIKSFDAAEFLDDDATISEYLTAILEDGDQSELLAAINQVARAKGMTELAHKTGMGRESLYKALTPGAQPRFSTLLKVLHALGIQLQATTVKQT